MLSLRPLRQERAAAKNALTPPKEQKTTSLSKNNTDKLRQERRFELKINRREKRNETKRE